MTRPPAFDEVLDQALEALARGEAVTAIVARYAAPAYPAGYAERLRPLLEAAEVAAGGLAMPIPPPDLARGRRRFLAAAQERRRTVAAWPRLPALRAAPLWGVALRRVGPALALGVMVVVLGLLVVVPRAAAAALPGDLLYPVKRAVEQVQLAVAGAPGEREALAAQLAEERRQEAERLLGLGREAQVAFEGLVEAVGNDWLVVSGLTVLSAEAGSFHTGERVAVEATARAGALVATRVRLLAAAPTPTVTPSPMPTVTRTATSTPSATLRPTGVLREVQARTVTPQRPTATATGTSPPTATRPSATVARPASTFTAEPARPTETAVEATREVRPTETRQAKP